MDSQTRARLENAIAWAEECAGEGELAGIETADGRALLAAYDALLTERAQAAPVLAALQRLVDTTNRVIDTIGPQLELIHEPGVERLAATASQALALLDAEQALAAWRAAQEG